MKVLGTESFDIQHFQKKNEAFKFTTAKKRRDREFNQYLEETLDGPMEELEEFRVLLPTNGYFWDNGYEDRD